MHICSRAQFISILLQVHAAGPGMLQKLGRVLKEKAVGDFERVFQGTSKTREKLGVRPLRPTVPCALHSRRVCGVGCVPAVWRLI